MKKLILTIAVMLSPGANAITCNEFVTMSELAMQVRQLGIDKAEFLRKLDYNRIAIPIVDAAYIVPIQSTDELKQQAVYQHKVLAEKVCNTQMGNDQ